MLMALSGHTNVASVARCAKVSATLPHPGMTRTPPTREGLPARTARLTAGFELSVDQFDRTVGDDRRAP